MCARSRSRSAASSGSRGTSWRFCGASALFHDVGKIAVPDAILTKPGKLTPAEFETIKEHSARGAAIVSKQSRLKDAVPAIRHHHERWDGMGYPDGLVEDQIPLAASIVGLADAWDAMTTDRPYAIALSQAAALAQVREGRGTQFPAECRRRVRGRRREPPDGAGHRPGTSSPAGRRSGLTDTLARMGERFQGGRLAAQALAAEGVDAIFTLSGGHVLPIYEGCRLEGLRVIDVRHEQSAGHAAEAWGRARRACGVAVVTAGPGVTGTVTAVANALAGQTPLLVIGGARPLAQAERGALQEFDQLSLMKPITKWAAVCPAAERIPEYVATAFRHALATPRGPVYLELPMDVLYAEAEAARLPSPAHTGARASGDLAEVERAGVFLSEAERPAIVAGSAIWWDGAAEALDALARHGSIPVFLNGSGRGSLPPDHPLRFQHARKHALANADVVCVVGAALDFRLSYGDFAAPTLVHIHNDPRELGRNRVPEVPIVGDSRLVLETLWPLVRPQTDRTAWVDSLRALESAWWKEHRPEIDSRSSPLNHYRLGAELDRVLDPGTVVIGDGGDVVAAVSRVLRVHRPGHWLDPGPFGCLGVGPGYASASGPPGSGSPSW